VKPASKSSILSDSHLLRAGGEEVGGDARQEAFEGKFAGFQELVSVGALADAEAAGDLVRQKIPVDDQHVGRVPRKRCRGGEAANAGADDDGFRPLGH
jgi:hypothetical protein